MAKGRQSEGKPDGRNEEGTPKLPLGVKLLRTLEGHHAYVSSVCFDPSGQTLASGSFDKRVILWNAGSGKLRRMLEGHQDAVRSVCFDPSGRTLASGSADRTVILWDADSGKPRRTLEGQQGGVLSVCFDSSGRTLAGGNGDGRVSLWEADSGRPCRMLEGHQDSVFSVSFDRSSQMLASGGNDTRVILWHSSSGQRLRTLEGHQWSVLSVAFAPAGGTLASGGYDNSVMLWDPASGKLLRTLEGHTGTIERITYSPDGRLLASKSADGTIRVWRCDTWEVMAIVPEPSPGYWIPALVFHSTLPLLATAGSAPYTPRQDRGRLIHLWELDFGVLLGRTPRVERPRRAVHHTTAKIVLVGDSGVGKTGLGWRLAHGEFKEHSSTHGQQFWALNELHARRKDGTECKAILWDLAGQPDYRLIHALFLDDADLALVLFDPTDSRDPLRGVEFWLRQLRVDSTAHAEGRAAQDNSKACPAILVAARCDRGVPTLTQEELEAFARNRGLSAYVCTSAKDGEGLDELLERMLVLIPWEEKAATVTTVTFKRIKDYVLKLKEDPRRKKVILSPTELRQRLVKVQKRWKFTDAEMMTAVGHLENYGYLKRLHTSKGEERILLAPELLNNLAASFVVQARGNLRGLGSLEEKQLLAGGCPFQELEGLTQEERDTLLDSAALLFIEHNICFRETDPLTQQSYLVFPELINLKKPVLENEKPTQDSTAYTVSGATENVFASLVVLLGYTHTFTRTNQWQNHARYEVGDGLVCGFRQDAERDGELDFVLYFCRDVPAPVRMLFQSLFENFLARRNLSVMRYEPVQCSKGHALNRAVVREALQHGEETAFCSKCGERLSLPRQEPIQLTRQQQAEVDAQRRAADERTRFEQAIFRVQNYAAEQNIKVPVCFISYAWGVQEHERWVERSLAKDLQKAGIDVILDRWENARVGASVSRFVQRIGKSSHVVVVGTPFYLEKYENKHPARGYVVAAEFDIIANRMLGTEAQKESVLPILLNGETATSFPVLLHDRVYADFRQPEGYFLAAFDLVLSLYGIAPSDQAVADLRESLCGPRLR